MNVAIVITRIGTPVATIRPSGVSAIVPLTTATTAPEIRLAAKKMRTAASTFGRYAQIAPTSVVSAATPSTDAAIENAPSITAQKTIRPTSHEGLGTARCRK